MIVSQALHICGVKQFQLSGMAHCTDLTGFKAQQGHGIVVAECYFSGKMIGYRNKCRYGAGHRVNEMQLLVDDALQGCTTIDGVVQWLT